MRYRPMERLPHALLLAGRWRAEARGRPAWLAGHPVRQAPSAELFLPAGRPLRVSQKASEWRRWIYKLRAALAPVPWKPVCGVGVLLLLVVLPVLAQPALPLMVDNFEGQEFRNRLGNAAHTFLKAPARILAVRHYEELRGEPNHVLELRYSKKEDKGWCGYYTRLARDVRYLNGVNIKAVTFRVRGETGQESFVVGLVDRYWEQAGDSARSQPVGAYLPAGRITRTWQKARIPAGEFYADFTQLTALVFIMEGAEKGAVYIDDLVLERS